MNEGARKSKPISNGSIRPCPNSSDADQAISFIRQSRMFGTHDFLLFVAAGLLLNITPGPDMLYIIGRSTTQGWRAGAAAALGIGAGWVVHIAAAALGLSAVLAASATAFTMLKIVGAVYLVYVGISL